MMFEYAFIDFDNTIYESHLLVDHIKATFVLRGVTDADFWETMELAVHGETGQYYDYSFELHLSLLEKKGYVFQPEETVKDLDAVFATSLQTQDAEVFLQFIRTRANKTILLTAGNNTFQTKKLSFTSLAQYFDEIHILHEDKHAFLRELNRDGDKNIFINDNLKQNCMVRDMFPNIAVITRRHPRKYDVSDFERTKIPYFMTLTEIQEYIETM